jgi:hypothetical protein
MTTLTRIGTKLKIVIHIKFSECGNTFCFRQLDHSNQEDEISYGRLSFPRVEYLEVIN